MANKEARWTDFLAPKYWPVWFGIGLLRFVSALPMTVGFWLGRRLGRLLHRLLKKRRHITEVNIALCFPEKSPAEQQQMVLEVFENNAIGFIETGWAYWGNKEHFKQITEYRGFDILDRALAEGNGVILMGAHYSPLDLAGLLFSLSGNKCSTLYRKHNSPMLEWFFTSGRKRFSSPLERKKTRQMLRDMRNNHCIWYAPDQDLGIKGAEFVPFFGIEAATTTATTKMHALNKSPLVILNCRRKRDDSGYIMEITEVKDFPSDDQTTDAAAINRAIELSIRKEPTQYMWVHKRFKTRPEGTTPLYSKAVFRNH